MVIHNVTSVLSDEPDAFFSPDPEPHAANVKAVAPNITPDNKYFFKLLFISLPPVLIEFLLQGTLCNRLRTIARESA